MQAIEINTKTDKNGHLNLTCDLNKREINVRVIILVDDKNEYTDEEKLWVHSISTNPAFDFLNEPEENIYSITDGEPFND